jgi:hypothetical protein
MPVMTKKMLLPSLLMILMAMTRFDHFGSALSLPDASLAIFFLAGLSLTGFWFFGALVLAAGLIDFVAITQLNVSDYCLSPAYAFLLPAYGVLWLAGRYCGKFAQFNLPEMLVTALILVLAASASFLISNSSFYLFSGRIESVSWAGFLTQFIHYYPLYLTSALSYGLAGLLLIKASKFIPDVQRAQTTF